MAVLGSPDLKPSMISSAVASPCRVLRGWPVRALPEITDPKAGSRRGTPFDQRAMQLVTLCFWGPCCAADLWLLSRGGAGQGGFVFWLLFREALVFLALWFAAAATRGLMLGNRA